MGFSCVDILTDHEKRLIDWGIADVDHMLRLNGDDMLRLGMPVCAEQALEETETNDAILIENFDHLNPIAALCDQHGLSYTHTQIFSDEKTVLTGYTIQLTPQGPSSQLVCIAIKDKEGCWNLHGLYADNLKLYLKLLDYYDPILNPKEVESHDIESEIFTEKIEGITSFSEHGEDKRPCFTDIKSHHSIKADLKRNCIIINGKRYSKEEVLPSHIMEQHHLDVYDQSMAGPGYSRLNGRWANLQLRLADEGKEFDYDILRASKVIFDEENYKRGVLYERLYFIDHNTKLYYEAPGYIWHEMIFHEDTQQYVIKDSKAIGFNVLDLYKHPEKLKNLDSVLATWGAKKENVQERVQRLLRDTVSITNTLTKAGFSVFNTSEKVVKNIPNNPLQDIIHSRMLAFSTKASSFEMTIGNDAYIFIFEGDCRFFEDHQNHFDAVTIFKKNSEGFIFKGMYVSSPWKEFVRAVVKDPSPMNHSPIRCSKEIESPARAQFKETLNELKTHVSTGQDTLKDRFLYLALALDALNQDTISDDEFSQLIKVINQTIGLLNNYNKDIADGYQEHIKCVDDAKKFPIIVSAMRDIAERHWEIVKFSEALQKLVIFEKDSVCKIFKFLTDDLLKIKNIDQLSSLDLQKLTRAVEGSIVFRDQHIDMIKNVNISPDILAKNNEYYDLIRTVQRFLSNDCLQNLRFHLVEAQYSIALRKLKKITNLAPPRSQEISIERSLTFALKSIALAEKNPLDDETISNYLEFCRGISKTINDIGTRILQDIKNPEQQKLPQIENAEIDLTQNMLLHARDPLAQLEKLGYKPIQKPDAEIAEYLKGEPKHVTHGRSTETYINKVFYPHNQSISRHYYYTKDIIGFDTIIKIKSNAPELVVGSSFICIFDDDSDYRITIEKNLKITDNREPLKPNIRGIPFTVVRVDKKKKPPEVGWKLVNRFVHEQHVTLANQLIEELSTAIDNCPIEVLPSAYKPPVLEGIQKKQNILQLEINKIEQETSLKALVIELNKIDKKDFSIDDFDLLIRVAIQSFKFARGEQLLPAYNILINNVKKKSNLSDLANAMEKLVNDKQEEEKRKAAEEEKRKAEEERVAALSPFEKFGEAYSKLGKNVFSNDTSAKYEILKPLYFALQNIDEDYETFTRVINESIARVENPEKEGASYVDLMQEVKAKTDYENNKILTAMFVVFAFTCIASLALIVPPVAAIVGLKIAVGYCIAAGIVTGLIATAVHEKINRYSPMYDAMLKVNQEKTNDADKDQSASLRATSIRDK